VVVSQAEVDLYRKRNAAAWFSGDEDEGDGDLSAAARTAEVDPFEPIPELPGLQRIRQRADGACGFLSPDNRCRIHEELGAARKPLTCRVFPYAFHPAADAVIVKASFGCPTIVANQGQPIAAGGSQVALESLRKEWFTNQPTASVSRQFVAGRAIDARSSRLLREHLLAMLTRDSDDLRDNLRRIAHTIDDLTRSRVLALPDADFAEYLSLTVPHAAKSPDAPPARAPGRIARLMQYGFLYTVTAMRATLDHSGQSRWQLRMRLLQLLAHFHGLAPGVDRVNVAALKHRRVDINDAEIRPIVFHYLRSTLHTLGGHGRPIANELAIAVSFLNAACALAVMNAAAAGTTVNRAVFSDALMETSDVSHARNGLLDWVLNRFGGGTEALWKLAMES
jgi:hypothetical protein